MEYLAEVQGLNAKDGESAELRATAHKFFYTRKALPEITLKYREENHLMEVYASFRRWFFPIKGKIGYLKGDVTNQIKNAVAAGCRLESCEMLTAFVPQCSDVPAEILIAVNLRDN